MAYPNLAQPPTSNVFDEHEYKLRATFAAAGAVAYRSLLLTMVNTGVGQWKLTLPMAYKEVTDFSCGWKRADGQNVLSMQIVTNNVAVDGTLVVEALTAAGVATNPAVGDVAFIELCVSADNLNDKFTGTG